MIDVTIDCMLIFILAVRCQNYTIHDGVSAKVIQGHYGDQKNVSCAVGYEALNSSLYTATCLQDKTWSDVHNCTGKR